MTALANIEHQHNTHRPEVKIKCKGDYKKIADVPRSSNSQPLSRWPQQQMSLSSNFTTASIMPAPSEANINTIS
jgi:hypothetical protein